MQGTWWRWSRESLPGETVSQTVRKGRSSPPKLVRGFMARVLRSMEHERTPLMVRAGDKWGKNGERRGGDFRVG